MNNVHAYWQVIVTSAREDGANGQRLIASLLQNLARIILVAAIYKAAYTFSATRPGLGFENVVWSIGLCFAFFINLGVRNIARTIDVEVKTGAVEPALLRPLDWRLFKLCELLGKNGIEFLLQMLLFPAVLLLIIGAPDLHHVTIGFVLLFLVFGVCAAITGACIFTMAGMTAFWLNDATSTFRIIDKLALVCCGTFVPLALLPTVLQNILHYSPFVAYAAPTQFFNPAIVPVLLPTTIWVLVWTATMILLCQLMWKRVERRIEVNGG